MIEWKKNHATFADSQQNLPAESARSLPVKIAWFHLLSKTKLIIAFAMTVMKATK